jgi:hypothetical protein
MALPLVREMGKLTLNKHEIQNGFALVIVNEEFKPPTERRKGAHVDREKIVNFCNLANFTVNDISGLNLSSAEKRQLKFTAEGRLETQDLTAAEMSDIFRIISKADFRPYDAFICFISSHGNVGGICGRDNNFVSLNEILRPVKICATLVGKPKLFFTQCCRGTNKDTGIVGVVPDQSYTITVPSEADILVSCSSVDGYESYRDEAEGSWFISTLTKALIDNADNMNLMDILTIVHEMVAKFEIDGWKQMPCVISTLRMAVHFEMSGATGATEAGEL